MSTERKPGSRGVMDTFAGGKQATENRFGAEPANRKNENPKGSTKTVSPRKSFKRKPRKK